MRVSVVALSASLALTLTGCGGASAPPAQESKAAEPRAVVNETRLPSASAQAVRIPSDGTLLRLNGTLEPDRDAEFVLGEEKGVLLLAQVIAPGDAEPQLSVHRADTGASLPDQHPTNAHWIERLPDTIGYLVVVHKTGKSTPFTLTLETPRALFPAANGVAEVTIPAPANSVVAYVLPPSKSIDAALTAGASDSFLTLNMLDTGVKIVSAGDNKRAFAGSPARTDDEIMLRVYQGAQSGDLTLRVSRQ